ncbi:MAG TPA: hypothetical protein VFA85_16090 [Terriglobales bacterium]|nr:hypothetical protein [Terriglobales bacterium]
MLQVAESIWQDFFQHHTDARKRYALVSGTKFTNRGEFMFSGINDSLKRASNPFEIIEALQGMLWTMETEIPRALTTACNRLRDGFSLSPTVMVQVVEHNGNVSLYPTGARMLDEALVESNLSWLAKYPKVAKAYEDALRAYVTQKADQYRNMLDSLRFAVEQLLQGILGNGKTLENQKEEFLRWLKAHDAHNQIGGMYHTLLFGYFAKYQNDAVKHQEDQYTPAEVEFVLYLTGTFLRFVQRLIEQEAPTKALPRPR